MIAFAAGQAKNAFFQDRIVAVPQRQCETDFLMTIADSRESVFIPTIGARSCVVVREIVPGGAPRALAEIWPPAFPMLRALTRFFQTLLFSSWLLSFV